MRHLARSDWRFWEDQWSKQHHAHSKIVRWVDPARSEIVRWWTPAHFNVCRQARPSCTHNVDVEVLRYQYLRFNCTCSIVVCVLLNQFTLHVVSCFTVNYLLYNLNPWQRLTPALRVLSPRVYVIHSQVRSRRWGISRWVCTSLDASADNYQTMHLLFLISIRHAIDIYNGHFVYHTVLGHRLSYFLLDVILYHAMLGHVLLLFYC